MLLGGKVKTETTCNSFAKAGISEKKCADALLDDPFKDLKDQLEKLTVHTFEFLPPGTMAKDVVSMDVFVNTSEAIINDEEIISDVLGIKILRLKKMNILI